MGTPKLLWILIVYSVGSSWAIEPFSITAAAVGLGSLVWGVIDKTPCRVMECCDKFSISTDAQNITALKNVLRESVYGQHLVQDIVVRALKGHMLSSDPSKALVLSFHGTPGSGKSYVSEFIAQSLFVNGMKSKFVKKFVAGSDFPDHSRSSYYQMRVSEIIQEVRKQCERSLFIFEDVQKMPPGVLNGIVPFIDHHTEVKGVDYRKTIFVLLSNTGASLINAKTLEMWKAGKPREDVTMKDFESIIREGSFNEDGGLQKSETIKTNLIDHYIPFLPLEEKHVRKCIEDAFKKIENSSPPSGAIENILEDLTFMPNPEQIYSSTGCKRVAAKVSAYVYGERFTGF